MRLAAGTGQQDGELVVIAQRQLPAFVDVLLEHDAAVGRLLADDDVLVEQLEAAEHGFLLDAVLADAAGIQHVETALSADEQHAGGRVAGGALVIGTHLQSVAAVVAAHDERVASVVLMLDDDVRDAVVGDEPHGVVGVLDDAVDGRDVSLMSMLLWLLVMSRLTMRNVLGLMSE